MGASWTKFPSSRERSFGLSRSELDSTIVDGERYLDTSGATPQPADAGLGSGRTPGQCQPPPAVVVPYDPRWPAQFESLRALADAALGGVLHVTEHVGSTAVPGLDAKPIIDIDVVVFSAGAVRPAIEALVQGGWEYEGDLGIAGREAFAPPGDVLYHHLYVVVQGNSAHRDHIDLRDFLRNNPAQAAAYVQRKHALAGLLRIDRAAYTVGKADLIADLLRQARAAPGGTPHIP